MATIKSYTDIEQSKVLAKILPLESADKHWIILDGAILRATVYDCFDLQEHNQDKGTFREYIPCWSLAALLELIADKNCTWLGTDDVSAWKCVFNLGKGVHYETTEYATPIDACVAMIEKLNESKML